MSSQPRLKGVAALISASLIVVGGGTSQPESTRAAEPPVETDTPPGVELTGLRTADTRTFATADGTYVTQFFTEPVFYQPEGAPTGRRSTPPSTRSAADQPRLPSMPHPPRLSWPLPTRPTAS